LASIPGPHKHLKVRAQDIPGDIFRVSLKFYMGDKLREKMEGGKRVETFFNVFYCAPTYPNCILKQF
jgi:hypothetical protein